MSPSKKSTSCFNTYIRLQTTPTSAMTPCIEVSQIPTYRSFNSIHRSLVSKCSPIIKIATYVFFSRPIFSTPSLSIIDDNSFQIFTGGFKCKQKMSAASVFTDHTLLQTFHESASLLKKS